MGSKIKFNLEGLIDRGRKCKEEHEQGTGLEPLLCQEQNKHVRAETIERTGIQPDSANKRPPVRKKQKQTPKGTLPY